MVLPMHLFFVAPANTEHSSSIWIAGWLKMSYTGQSKLDTPQSTEFGSRIVLTIGRNEYSLWELYMWKSRRARLLPQLQQPQIYLADRSIQLSHDQMQSKRITFRFLLTMLVDARDQRLTVLGKTDLYLNSSIYGD